MRTDKPEAVLFYDLTKEEVEAQSPHHLRAIIRKAYDNKRPGYGPGPTMNDVIKHYESEQTYRMIRGCNTDMVINEALDVLFEYNGLAEGMIAWMLPSMVSGSDKTWHVHRFNFSSAVRTHPKVLEKLQAAGWYV